ncbi:MAG: sigma-70 family RNA polymerase sigma factor [Candidatus Thorarchaeota archaeon]|jgi:RNA polymerase sigma factor (sigma-70 family)
MTCLTLEERNELVENYLPLAESLAWKKSRVTPNSISIDELKSAAYMGLVLAASRFDTEKGSFGGYAAIRITGEIKDYLRKCGKFPSVSLDTAVKEDDFELSSILESPKDENPEEFFEEATKCLNDLGKKVVISYYKDNQSLKQIGLRINVSESRVSQIIKGCRNALRNSWTELELREAV